MRCNSRITVNQRRIKQLSRAAVTSLEQTAEAVHTEVVQSQVIPRDKGTLQGEAFSPDYSNSGQGRVSLVHSTPYARRMYFHPEYHFQTDENPNAKGKWFEDWLPGGKKSNFAKKKFKELYRRNAGL